MNLHCMHEEKFIEPFIGFIEKNFDDSKHKYLIRRSQRFKSKARENILFVENNLGRFAQFLLYTKHLNRADKIFLHGLFHNAMFVVLFMQPWLLKKCYWIIWGGDLYSRQKIKKGYKSILSGWVRFFVISRVGNFVTQIKGDYELAQQWYGARGRWHECFVYPSNLYHEAPTESLAHEGINILLGNSADPSNNHIEVLDKLKCYAGEKIRVYCPLSYGNQEYAAKISAHGTFHFGENFIALREFMPLDKYAELLSKIDIAIFNHKRQQGMGNITTLLGMGKKVYLRKEITTWGFLQGLGAAVFDINSLEFSKLEAAVSDRNSDVIKKYFSENNLISQLNKLFL